MKLLRLLLISVLCFSTPIQASKSLTVYFEREAKLNHFNGVVHISSNTTPVVLNNNVESINFPFDQRTRFNIGSITKQFTAAGILQLVDRKLLELSKPVNIYLGEYSDPLWREVSVHQLLTHTSGIPSIYQTEQGIDIFFPEEKPTSLKSLISKFKGAELLFEPGKKFSYSNSGYVLLAAIIEAVSGQEYFEYMQQNLFEKYDLQNTSFQSDINTAQPFLGFHHQLRKAIPSAHPTWSYGAGDLYSTTEDLSKWAKIIFSPEFLTAQLREEFLKGHVELGNDSMYGYGWVHRSDSVMEHDGATSGYVSQLSINKKTLEHHVILTNQSHKDIHLLSKSSGQVAEWSNAIWKWRSDLGINFSAPDIGDLGKAECSLVAKIEDVHKKTSNVGCSLLTDTEIGKLFQAATAQAISTDTEVGVILNDIAQKLKSESYYAMAKHFDWEMKLVTYSGLMWFGMSEITESLKGIEHAVPYRFDGNNGWIRLSSASGEVDIMVVFNDALEVIGMFDIEIRKIPKGLHAPVYKVAENTYYLDGFEAGREELFVNIDNSGVYVKYFDRNKHSF